MLVRSRVSFKAGPCAGTCPHFASLLGPGLGKTQEKEIGITRNSPPFLLVSVDHEKAWEQR